MKKAKNIVYLYSEVMPYAISIMRALVSEFSIQVDCIYWDEQKKTPFLPENEPGLTFYKRSGFDSVFMLKFIEERSPDIIYVSGRMDKLYLETVLKVRDKCKVVAGSDKQWEHGMNGYISVLLSNFLYRKYFHYMWVPGRRQYEFAKRIGYDNTHVLPNLLTADDAIFGMAYEENLPAKKIKYPHNFVFAGRFAKVKGLDLLIDVFTELKTEMPNDWQLTLIGAGDMPMPDHADIHVSSFMKGAEMAMESKNWGVFCLPSTREPWGVVVHEAVMVGLPVLCADSVGAADALVIDKYNGFVFRSGNKDQLKDAMRQVIGKSDDELLAMGAHGHQLSKMQSPLIAAYSLMTIAG